MSNRVVPPYASVAERERDLEANYFAMCLLMDETMLRAEVRVQAPHGFDLVDEPALKILAKRFGVSVQLMILRLVQLGYFDEILKR